MAEDNGIDQTLNGYFEMYKHNLEHFLNDNLN